MTRENSMRDPSYVKEVIDANQVWELAFTISEIQNDNAPIGWGQYIMLAECLLSAYTISRKTSRAAQPSREAFEAMREALRRLLYAPVSGSCEYVAEREAAREKAEAALALADKPEPETGAQP